MCKIKPVDDITSRDLSSSGKKLLNEVVHIYHGSAAKIQSFYYEFL